MTGTEVRKSLAITLLALVLGGSITACDVQTYDDAVASLGDTSGGGGGTGGGGTGGGGSGGGGTGGGGTGGAAFGPNYSEIQASLFDVRCTGCHGGANPSAGLNLEAGMAYANLVGIESSQAAGVLLVNPTDPDTSYLVQKLEGNGVTVMPPSGMIPQVDIDVVRQWITAGAIDDTVVVLDPIQVQSLAPMPGASLGAAPTQIIAGFTRDLDASTVNTMTFTLTASGNGSFGDGDDVQVMSAGVAVGANPSSAVMDLTGVVLVDDTYRVTLFGSGASIIMDLDANALDGEFSGGFPSGDGVAGGTFIADFTLSTAPDPVRVQTLSPAPGSTVATAPTEITATFTEDLVAGAIDATSFTLTASIDGIFDNGNDVQVMATSVAAGATPSSAVMDLTGVALANDTYRVTLLDTITDVNGNALDGEFSGGLPSGDGTAGGDFQAQFTVDVPSALDIIQATIFTPNCASCHSGAGSISGIANMDLTNADAAYATLVDQPSAQDGNFIRVVPGDPANSLLLQKLQGVATVGGPLMPPTGMLGAADITAVSDWIAAGAER